jgi:anhydro-N-acetylmuramic acid kinase
VALYLGLMSGTSLDGVDAVLVDFDDAAKAGHTNVLGHAHSPYAESLRAELLALNSPGHDELHRAALAANRVALAYGDLVAHLLDRTGTRAAQVQAVGAHGQTVRHRPQEFDGGGYTLQLLNGALLAELTSIDVVCDFRSRDLAAGGQGAPLVPAFHAERFSRPGEDVAVLNLGGIANLTLLPAGGQVLGFDCGPGNGLMDAWCRRHLGTSYDKDGRWAAAGQVSAELLNTLLAEPFFSRRPPKSTGRDLFNAEWLQSRLALFPALQAGDVMATLAELTAMAALSAVSEHQPGTRMLLVCGGGAYNGHLMSRLAALRPTMSVRSTASAGLVPDQVEALAFAWLAREFMLGHAGNVPAVTGAGGPRPLGALHPAAVSGRQFLRTQP